MDNQCMHVVLGLDEMWWRALGAIAALLVSYTVARFAIRNKQIDFILYNHKQFDELQKKRTEILVGMIESKEGDPSTQWTGSRLEIEAKCFFDRFWGLQFDSFVGWHQGYIPTAIYKYWLFARWQEIANPSDHWSFNGQTMQTSFRRIWKEWPTNLDRKSFPLQELCKFLDLMKDLSEDPRVDVDRLLRQYGPHPIPREVRRFFGAY